MPEPGLTPGQRVAKRVFDLAAAGFGLLAWAWLLALLWLIGTVHYRRNGFFTQVRIGRLGRPFRILKLRTMRPSDGRATTVTTAEDPRVDAWGAFLRRSKLDELPQLWNVLVGDMSLIGPRPDVRGFADRLRGQDRIVLSVRPGITGPATIRFRDEEGLLAAQAHPERFNREVLFPEKTRLNRRYVEEYRFRRDLHYLWRTLRG
jgi:lipopolysaccharide/colanic/teichoic acid biosynthesis glycosyltransferase